MVIVNLVSFSNQVISVGFKQLTLSLNVYFFDERCCSEQEMLDRSKMCAIITKNDFAHWREKIVEAQILMKYNWNHLQSYYIPFIMGAKDPPHFSGALA